MMTVTIATVSNTSNHACRIIIDINNDSGKDKDINTVVATKKAQDNTSDNTNIITRIDNGAPRLCFQPRRDIDDGVLRFSS